MLNMIKIIKMMDDENDGWWKWWMMKMMHDKNDGWWKLWMIKMIDAKNDEKMMKMMKMMNDDESWICNACKT